MGMFFELRSSGKGRKEIARDLKWDGVHRPGNLAHGKGDVSPNPKVQRPICMQRVQNTLSGAGFSSNVMCWLNKGDLYGFWRIHQLLYWHGLSAVSGYPIH